MRSQCILNIEPNLYKEYLKQYNNIDTFYKGNENICDARSLKNALLE